MSGSSSAAQIDGWMNGGAETVFLCLCMCNHPLTLVLVSVVCRQLSGPFIGKSWRSAANTHTFPVNTQTRGWHCILSTPKVICSKCLWFKSSLGILALLHRLFWCLYLLDMDLAWNGAFSDVSKAAYRNTMRKANMKTTFLGDGRVFISAFPLVERLRVCLYSCELVLSTSRVRCLLLLFSPKCLDKKIFGKITARKDANEYSSE